MGMELDIGVKSNRAFVYNNTTGNITRFHDLESLQLIFPYKLGNNKYVAPFTEQDLLDFWFDNFSYSMTEDFFKEEIKKIKELFK